MKSIYKLKSAFAYTINQFIVFDIVSDPSYKQCTLPIISTYINRLYNFYYNNFKEDIILNPKLEIFINIDIPQFNNDIKIMIINYL